MVQSQPVHQLLIPAVHQEGEGVADGFPALVVGDGDRNLIFSLPLRSTGQGEGAVQSGVHPRHSAALGGDLHGALFPADGDAALVEGEPVAVGGGGVLVRQGALYLHAAVFVHRHGGGGAGDGVVALLIHQSGLKGAHQTDVQGLFAAGLGRLISHYLRPAGPFLQGDLQPQISVLAAGDGKDISRMEDGIHGVKVDGGPGGVQIIGGAVERRLMAYRLQLHRLLIEGGAPDGGNAVHIVVQTGNGQLQIGGQHPLHGSGNAVRGLVSPGRDRRTLGRHGDLQSLGIQRKMQILIALGPDGAAYRAPQGGRQHDASVVGQAHVGAALHGEGTAHFLVGDAVHGQTLYLVDPAGVLVSKIQIQSLTEKIGAHRLHGDGGLGARGPRPKGQQGKQHGQGQSQRQQPCPLFGDSHGVVFSFRCSDEMRHAPRHGALDG